MVSKTLKPAAKKAVIPVAKTTAAAISDTYRGTAPRQDLSQSWSELEDLYQKCATGIYETLSSVTELVNYPNLMNYVTNPSEFRVAVDGFKRDIDLFTNQLIAIHAMHSQRSGNITTEDELAAAFSIYGLYTEFFDNFKSLSFQTVLSITDMAMEAINRSKSGEPK